MQGRMIVGEVRYLSLMPAQCPQWLPIYPPHGTARHLPPVAHIHTYIYIYIYVISLSSLSLLATLPWVGPMIKPERSFACSLRSNNASSTMILSCRARNARPADKCSTLSTGANTLAKSSDKPSFNIHIVISTALLHSPLNGSRGGCNAQW
jgi:hypothetical protein